MMEALGSIDQAVERAIQAIQICHYKPGTMDPSGPNRDMFYKLTKSPSYPFVRHLQCKMGLLLLTSRVFSQTDVILLGQESHQSILLTTVLPKNGLQVEHGVELISLEQFEDYVAVKLRHLENDLTEEVKYKYVIGCDGGRGAVRKQLGLKFIGESQTQRFVVADVRLPDFPSDVCSFIVSMDFSDNITGMAYLGRYQRIIVSNLICGSCFTVNIGAISILFRPTDVKGLFALTFGGAHFDKYSDYFVSHESMKKLLVKMTGTDVFERAEFAFTSSYK